MGTVKILPQTMENPLEFIGSVAGVAYNTDTTNREKNIKRAVECIESQHGRLLEFIDVYMVLEGWSARVMREFFRHVGDGLTALQASTRYINYKNFEYYTPPAIAASEGTQAIYDDTMKHIGESVEKLMELGIKREDVGNLLPLGMTSTVAIKKNARCLSNMSEQRLCNRALLEYRQLMREIIKQLKEYSPEWEQFADMIFGSKCEKLGYCPEAYSCGRYPKKQ